MELSKVIDELKAGDSVALLATYNWFKSNKSNMDVEAVANYVSNIAPVPYDELAVALSIFDEAQHAQFIPKAGYLLRDNEPLSQNDVILSFGYNPEVIKAVAQAANDVPKYNEIYSSLSAWL